MRQVCTGANSTGVDPYQILVIGFPANATASGSTSTCPRTRTACPWQPSAVLRRAISVQVGLVAGALPGRIKVAIEDNGAGVTFTGVPVTGGTLQGHPERYRRDGRRRRLLERHDGLRQTPATCSRPSPPRAATRSCSTAPAIRSTRRAGRCARSPTSPAPTVAVTRSSALLWGRGLGPVLNSGNLPELLRHLGGHAARGGRGRTAAAAVSRRSTPVRSTQP